MFLQKFKIQNGNNQKNNQSYNKIIDVIKKLSVPEIKNHQKKTSYIDPRRNLIQYTTKMIGLNRKAKSAQPHQQHKDISQIRNTQQIIKKPNKNILDLTFRQDRITAAKKFRQKIWKSNDITILLKKQQKSHLYPRRIYNSHDKQYQLEDSQKIIRYADLTPFQKRQKFQRQWLQNSIKLQSNKSNEYAKNPQIQIKNIKFLEQDHFRHAINYSRMYNRQKRKQMKIMNLHYKDKRPNTTGYNRDKYDDIIEPW